MGEVRLSAPALLAATHDIRDFCCGIDSLDEWLKQRAHQNQRSGASRTYVVASRQKVIGYYCLASGALALSQVPKPMRRNMPDPVPMVILGRLAVDQAWQGQGIGVALLQDAVLRTIQASGILGIRGLLVQAISEQAKAFYERYGFVASPTQPMTLILSLKGLVTDTAS
jgi:GNAT superfamily N-acetyltransferase